MSLPWPVLSLFLLVLRYCLPVEHGACKIRIFGADKIELIGTIILVTPGLVISTGLFLLLRSFTDVFSLAFFIVIAVNSLMALPYVIKTLAQPMRCTCLSSISYVCASLGMTGFTALGWWSGEHYANLWHTHFQSASCLQWETARLPCLAAKRILEHYLCIYSNY